MLAILRKSKFTDATDATDGADATKATDAAVATDATASTLRYFGLFVLNLFSIKLEMVFVSLFFNGIIPTPLSKVSMYAKI